ncbi:hypothetical protein DVH24_009538 [Malus domestica]|uniref:Uncharacterized protein n=1 Tax=Malus domestica TaxID=3750 RepID=A0A498IUA5_MALDO|nr:hypothetical protein DVH24_009538 [Malus domestica]
MAEIVKMGTWLLCVWKRVLLFIGVWGIPGFSVFRAFERRIQQGGQERKGSRVSLSSIELCWHTRRACSCYPPLDHLLGDSFSECAKGQIEVANSTKAPPLGKSSKQDKKKAKEHIELEEPRKSTERGVSFESANLDSNNQAGADSSIAFQKDLGSMRIRSFLCFVYHIMQ